MTVKKGHANCPSERRQNVVAKTLGGEKGKLMLFHSPFFCLRHTMLGQLEIETQLVTGYLLE